MEKEIDFYHSALEKACQLAQDFLQKLDTAPVGVSTTYKELYEGWNDELAENGIPPEQVIEELNKAALPGLMLNQSGRFFAWVIGGGLPAALAADWLTSTWDQNSGLYNVAPSGAIVEEIAGEWLKKIFKLPSQSSFAFVTGCQMAHFTCLNVARNHLFHSAGWDIETQGFYGAPPVRIICGDQKHVTVNRALRLLGFGLNSIIEVRTDDVGRMNVEHFASVIAKDQDKLTIVMLQAGDVNTGVFDDFKSIIPIARQHNAWVHIDGAFGLWAIASNKYAHLTEGIQAADSWATDGHKWLNVPYDCGYAFVAHPGSHSRSFSLHASYISDAKQGRDQMDWNPEFSRRGRGFATYAAIRELGTKGIEDLIDRTCQHAYTIVTESGKFPHTEIISIPIINQGLIRFIHPTKTSEKDIDEFTEAVINAINKTGEAFFQPTTFKGKRCMRVSVSSWRTNDEDVRRTVAAIERAIVEVSGR